MDNSHNSNFSVGYSTMKSDIVVHLAQWQYWWWFWFSFLWGFYYLVSNRSIRYRVMKFRPRIYTSYRSHGKWGDFLACIVPAIWCLNILTNSNFILKLIEWQNEASLFSVRLRARQWYWVYKFEARNIVDFVSVPKNVGRNRWVISFGGAFEVADNYFHILKLRAQNSWLRHYWSDYVLVYIKNLNNKTNSLDFSNHESLRKYRNLDFERILNLKKNNNKFRISSKLKILYMNDLFNFKSINLLVTALDIKNCWKTSKRSYNNLSLLSSLNNKFYFFNKIKYELCGLGFESLYNTLFYRYKDYYVDSQGKRLEPFNYNNRSLKKFVSEMKAVIPFKTSLIKIDPNKVDENTFKIIDLNFNKEVSVLKKTYSKQNFFVIKQKRYKLRQTIPLRVEYDKTDYGMRSAMYKFKSIPWLGNFSIVNEIEINPTRLYKVLKKSRHRVEFFTVELSRRLLRTKKTLVLPANVNMTLITNSYDVIHSWFLPTLGVKLDCVPGRSTHHSFYLDSLGFFYGQCAEICGRYHHHMPIRICSLPYEHFFVWWQHFGLPKLLNIFGKDSDDIENSHNTFEF